jgi:capsular polysaccharide transport system permease protein
VRPSTAQVHSLTCDVDLARSIPFQRDPFLMGAAASTTVTPRRRDPWEVQRDVLFALLLREIKARVGGQWVGAVWTLFEPLAHVALMVALFGFLRNTLIPGIEYPLYLTTGLVPFFLFQHLGIRLMDGIEANRGLYAYRQVKPLDPLLARAVVEALMNMVVYAFTLVWLSYMEFHVLPDDPLAMIGVHAVLFLLGTAFGVFVAVVSHDRPRLRTLIRMTMLPLYFASGVIFRVDLLAREYIEWLLWNPLLHLIELSRHAFIPAYAPIEGVDALYPVMATLLLSALALAAYRADRQRLLAIG